MLTIGTVHITRRWKRMTDRVCYVVIYIYIYIYAYTCAWPCILSTAI
jgi:hypothetical protein